MNIGTRVWVGGIVIALAVTAAPGVAADDSGECRTYAGFEEYVYHEDIVPFEIVYRDYLVAVIYVPSDAGSYHAIWSGVYCGSWLEDVAQCVVALLDEDPFEGCL